MQGIFIGAGRPRSKKQVKETASADPRMVIIEATSMLGNEYSGSLYEAPDGTYNFVGPDPHRDRKFYGTIVKRDGKVTVK